MKKTIDGIIISTKMKKTVSVKVVRHVPHRLYKKLMKKSKKFLADTGELTVSMGDMVRIEATRPLSKNKHFKVVEVLGKGGK